MTSSLLLLFVLAGALSTSCSDGSDRPGTQFQGEDAGSDAPLCADEDGDHHSALICGGDDCDDTNDAVHPDAQDNPCADLNCDGRGGPDEDDDGELDDECGGRDCNDRDPAINSTAIDAFGDGMDQNCDGADGIDGDGDGAASPASGGDDCDDADPEVGPLARDTAGDSVDQNCDGIDGTDADGDQVASAALGGTDCNDQDPQSYPGARDTVGDGVDQDCGGIDGVDGDGDLFATVASGGDDCDDLDPAIHPFAQGDWIWELLSDRMRGDPPEPVLDSNGDVRVAYIEEDEFGVNQIILANNASGAWEFESVGPSRYCVAMDLDADDGVHLVYRNAQDIPQYATNVSGDWVFEPIGGTTAIANCTVDVAPNGVVHTIFSTDALAVTHGHRAVDDWLFVEVAQGEVITTDLSLGIDPRSTLHVAYSDGTGVHYVANDTAGYADSNEAGGGNGGAEPFALANGDTLIVAVDGGAHQTVTFATGDFANIAAATAEEIAAAVNEQIVGAVATVVGNGTIVRITSGTVGPSSVVDVDALSSAIAGGKLDMTAGSAGTHTGGRWYREDVDAGLTAFIALYGNVPGIVYQGVPRMFYAERTGPGAWQTDELPWDAVSPHLTYASDGYRHAVFGDVGTGNVVWARSGGVGWASEPVQPTEGNETVGRILMTAGDEPVFFIVEELDDETSLYFVERGPEDEIDQDCDGRVR